MTSARSGGEPASVAARSRTALRALGVLAVLAAAIAIVFHPIVFGGYTFAQAWPSIDTKRAYAGSETVALLDPAAGASQDEPWLHELRERLLEGEVPLVNLRNGLGATFLESLQPGVFYPGNLALPLLPGGSARMFDAFVLLHALLLGCGLYVLARLYARPSIALSVALVVVLSGVTYQHVNMVHFRSFAWSPWAVAAAVRIARDGGRAKHVLAFVVAHACAIAAGALQEALVSSLAAGAVFVIELVLSPREGRWRRFATFAACAVASTLLAAPSFVPYFAARAAGDVFSAVHSGRALEGIEGDGLLTLLVPGVHGRAPYLVRLERGPRWMTDFATLGAFLVVFACVAAWLARDRSRRRLVLAFAALATVGVLKVHHVAALDWVRHVPLASEVLFAKYHLWLFTILAIVGAAGVQAAVDLDPRSRRRAVIVAGVLVAAMLLATDSYVLASDLWIAPDPWPQASKREYVVAMCGSVGGFVIGAWIAWRAPRRAGAWLAALVVAQALAVRPDGWFARNEAYQVRKGAETLAASAAPVRVLSATPSNQNLLEGYEALGSFDPVQNAAAHRLLGTFFRVDNPGFDLTPLPKKPEGFGKNELDVARFCAVTHLLGVPTRDAEGIEHVDGELFALQGGLPRVFVLGDAAYRELDASTRARATAWMVDAIATEIAARPQPRDVRIQDDAVAFASGERLEGWLVLAQAATSAWTFEGRSGETFCGLYPAWRVDLAPGEHRFEYVPRGLRASWWLAVVGVACAGAVAFFAQRSSRRVLRQG